MADLPYIPGYRLVRELGRGGMAVVYLAVQEKLNRDVAVKILSPELQSDRDFAARFVREARTAANLRHTHIVAVHDVGRHGDLLFMVMEHLAESLKDRILMKFGKPFPAAEVLAVLGPISAALEYAHGQGIVHRDLKPDNIMFRADGTPVLVDFGLAKATAAPPGRHTDTRLAIGTPHYMSPEQGLGQPLDARSDIYGLGVVLFEMLTGRVPFEADSAMAVMLRHIQEPAPRLPAETARFQLLLDRLLAKEPGQRLQTAGELKEWLERAAGPEPVPPVAPARGADRPAAPERRRRDWRPAAAILALFALLAFAAGFLLNRPRASRPPPAALPAAQPRAEPSAPLTVERAPAGRQLEVNSALRDSGQWTGLQQRPGEPASPPLPAAEPRRPAPTRIRPAPGTARPSAPAAPPRLVLRTTFAELDADEARALLRRFGFYDRYENSRGLHAGQFRRSAGGGSPPLIEDLTSGVTWLAEGSAQAVVFSDVPAWLERLGRTGIPGGSSWRLPTLEEAASLLASRRGPRGLFLDPLFPADQPEIWTGDRLRGQPDRIWVVLFGDGCLGTQPASSRCFIRPVLAR